MRGHIKRAGGQGRPSNNALGYGGLGWPLIELYWITGILKIESYVKLCGVGFRSREIKSVGGKRVPVCQTGGNGIALRIFTLSATTSALYTFLLFHLKIKHNNGIIYV